MNQIDMTGKSDTTQDFLRLRQIEAGNILADTTLMQITVVANSTIGIEPNETPHIEVSQCFLAWNH